MVEKPFLPRGALDEAYRQIFTRLVDNWFSDAVGGVASGKERFIHGLEQLHIVYSQVSDIIEAK